MNQEGNLRTDVAPGNQLDSTIAPLFQTGDIQDAVLPYYLRQCPSLVPVVASNAHVEPQ